MDPNEPLPGDLILFGGGKHESLASRLVEAGELVLTGDDSEVHYSHVGLWESHQIMLEAVWPRIRRSRIDLSRTFVVLRFEGLNDTQRFKIMDAARQRIGEPYNLLYIFLGGWTHAKIKGTEVCSLYAQDCYANAMVALDGSMPDALAYDKRLRVIQRNSPDA